MTEPGRLLVSHRRRPRWLIPTAVAAAVVLVTCVAGAIGGILAAGDPDGDPPGAGDTTEEQDEAGEQACRSLTLATDTGVLGVVQRNAATALTDEQWSAWVGDVRAIGLLAARSDDAEVARIGGEIDTATGGETANPMELVTMTLDLAGACVAAGIVTNADVAQAVGESADAPAEPPAEAADITEGVWTVGVDIDPGTYRTTDVAGGDCYWSVLVSGTNGGDIVANHIGGGRPIVTLADGQDFETSRCGGWSAVDVDQLRVDADPATTVEEGLWTVGVDIAAGTYRPVEPAGEDCYWAVLSSGSNGVDIVNNDIGGGRPAVTLSEGQDFESSRCGTWGRDSARY